MHKRFILAILLITILSNICSSCKGDMKTSKELEKEFWEKGKPQPSGKWIIFPQKVAIEFVEACEKNKVIILGIDGFFVKGDTIQPSMANSLDFTNSNYSEYNTSNRYLYSIDFLNKKDTLMYFEIVCKE